MTTSERFLEIQELFHAAVKLAPEERRSFLLTRCPNDASLRQEVEMLLAEDVNPSAVLDANPEQSRSFTLPIGTRLGPYELIGTIGAGGMGEVYRARDSNLQRSVAIKILPGSFACDPDRISRFRREAQLLASLNHPNIAAIYGLEESGPVLAIVMELVEGPTLSERIAAGPVPVQEALRIAKQMTEALGAAHERGIVHRDFKPANIKIAREGAVKVLDFGLGKFINTDDAPAQRLHTLYGMVLGTAPYMAPEQARCAAVDERADIWAFGVVLYELLTGERLFAGDTRSDVLAAVLAKEPDWTRIPGALRRLLQRCLQKDPKQRLHDIRDVWALVDDEPQTPPTPKRTWILSALVCLMIITACWAVWRASRIAPTPLQPLLRLNVDLGHDVSLGSLRGPDAILSPDGTRLVYVSHSRLFTRRLDLPDAIELAGTQKAFSPFFSPDGQWVAYFADYKLKKVAIQGGPPIDICDALWPNGGSWGEDGSIIAAIDRRLVRVSSDGGIPAPVTELAPGELVHRWPQILPGGKAVLFSAYSSVSGLNGATIQVVSMTGHRRRTLWRDGTFARYLPNKQLLFLHNGTLLALPFDPDRLEVHPPPFPVMDGIGYNAESGFGQISFSAAGSVVYRSGAGATGLVTVQLLDGSGGAQQLLAEPSDYVSPTLSPDGNRLAMTSGGDLWVYDLKRETMTRFTAGGGYTSVLWSPDSQYLVFRGQKGILFLRADGSGTPQVLVRSENVGNQLSFTPDGKRLAYVENNSKTGADLFTVPMQNEAGRLRAGTPEIFLQTAFDERGPAFSPDGRWLAYFSIESGRSVVYVRGFPDNGVKRQISNDDGSNPLWSRNGRELFFRNRNSQIMVAQYTVKEGKFLADKPRLWSETFLARTPTTSGFDVAADGTHIVATLPAENAEDRATKSHVVFLLNFPDELRRRGPTGGRSIR